MKNIILTTFTIWVIVVFLTIIPALAENRVKVFEMNESGVTFEFPMTPEEIAAEDRERARLAELKEDNKKKIRARFEVVEMGESGQTVSFAMSAKEIADEDARTEELAAYRDRAAKTGASQNRVVKFELAESGFTFEVPVEKNFETQKNFGMAGMDEETARKYRRPKLWKQPADLPDSIDFKDLDRDS